MIQNRDINTLLELFNNSVELYSSKIAFSTDGKESLSYQDVSKRRAIIEEIFKKKRH